MLGRTDSRSRLLFLLVVFVVGSLRADRRAWRTGRSSTARRLAAEALAQTTVRSTTPSQRGEIYDRTGTVVLATTVQRERLVAAPDQLTPEQRRHDRRRPDPRSSASTTTDATALRDKLTGDAKYVILRHGLERQVADRIRAAIAAKRPSASSLEPEPERVYPQVGRRPGLDASPRTCSASSTARAAASTASSSTTRRTLAGEPRVVVAQRDASGRPILDDATVDRRPARPGTDLRLTIDAGLQLRGRAGAAGGLGRRPGQERLGRRDGPVHRRDLRRGDLPVVRRATTTRRSPRRTRRASSTRSSRASTSRARCSR